MAITEQEIIEFLVTAKKHTYASENRPVQPSSRLGSKDLAFEQGDLHIGTPILVIRALLAQKWFGIKHSQFGR